MRFFTDEKFQNNTAHAEYEKYCRDHWDKLPHAFRVIQFEQIPEEILGEIDKISLHDSRITDFSESGDEVTLNLNADHRGGLRVVTIQYSGVTKIKKPGISNLGDDIENPDSDLMCHEVFIDGNLFQHTILFASNEILDITFKDIQISYEDK